MMKRFDEMFSVDNAAAAVDTRTRYGKTYDDNIRDFSRQRFPKWSEIRSSERKIETRFFCLPLHLNCFWKIVVCHL